MHLRPNAGWPDILAPNETQPRKPLLVGQRDTACLDHPVDSPQRNPTMTEALSSDKRDRRRSRQPGLCCRFRPE